MIKVKDLIITLQRADPESAISTIFNQSYEEGMVVGEVNLAYQGVDGKFYIGSVSNGFLAHFYKVSKEHGKIELSKAQDDEFKKLINELESPPSPKTIEQLIKEGKERQLD